MLDDIGQRFAMNALARSAALLETKLGLLERRLRDGDESALADYCLVARTLAAVSAAAVPGAGGGLLTTKQMAARLQISTKALLRRKKELEPIRLGQRGRGALRWAAR